MVVIWEVSMTHIIVYDETLPADALARLQALDDSAVILGGSVLRGPVVLQPSALLVQNLYLDDEVPKSTPHWGNPRPYLKRKKGRS